jgi:hypothetical protein
VQKPPYAALHSPRDLLGAVLILWLIPRRHQRIMARWRSSRCIFCGRSPLTKEHVWSRWTHRYIPHNPSQQTGRALVAVEYRDRTEFRRMRMPPDPRQWQVRAVCARCNNEWMSHLENQIKPILMPLFAGQQCRLEPEKQVQIATWITLKTMICEFDRLGKIVSHHTQRKRMMAKHLPP